MNMEDKLYELRVFCHHWMLETKWMNGKQSKILMKKPTKYLKKTRVVAFSCFLSRKSFFTWEAS
jgi:hypothetical protein